MRGSSFECSAKNYKSADHRSEHSIQKAQVYSEVFASSRQRWKKQVLRIDDLLVVPKTLRSLDHGEKVPLVNRAGYEKSVGRKAKNIEKLKMRRATGQRQCKNRNG